MAAERLFFALWPPARVRDALAAESDALSGKPGRQQHPDDLHMTLVYLGVVDDERRGCVDRVGDVVQVAPFALRIVEAGYWHRPRIRWCRPAQAPPALLSLVGQLQDGLRRCGLEPEARPYRPHVTLVRKAPPLTHRPLSAPLDWDVDAFVLAASGHEGQRRYRVLRRWQLVA